MFVVSPGPQPAPRSPGAREQHMPGLRCLPVGLHACVLGGGTTTGRGGKPEITFGMAARLPLCSGTCRTASFLILS